MYRDLTRGSILRSLLLFALPMLAGDILQQLYNIADTFIVSRAIGRDALAAVGSAYTLMIFLTSILLGLSMGAGALFSICRGRGDESGLRQSIVHAFALIGVCTLLLTALAYALLPALLRLLQVPESVSPLMRTYLAVIFAGIPATFLYNFFACLLRSVGNSMTPLVFSGISALGNVDHSLVEAAQVDGANLWQRICYITIPLLKPTIIILFLLSIGKIMSGDLTMMMSITNLSPMLLDTTDIIDTYVYRSVIGVGDFVMGSAVGLYQSIFGFILVLFSNWLVGRFDKDYQLF